MACHHDEILHLSIRVTYEDMTLLFETVPFVFSRQCPVSILSNRCESDIGVILPDHYFILPASTKRHSLSPIFVSIKIHNSHFGGYGI